MNKPHKFATAGDHSATGIEWSSIAIYSTTLFMLTVKIHQRGVQGKQGVVVYIIL